MPSLTVSGNEITDASRAAGTAGDGLLNDSSFGIWEATTNLVTNGGFETNATGWNAVSAAIARVTAQFKFGAASGEIVSSNLVANEGAYHNFTATAAVYTVSAWVRGAAGGTVRMAVRDSGGLNPQTGTAVTLTSSWQRITLTTTALTAATWRCYVETNVQQNITFQADGVQAELQPLATPYVHTDGATAARAAARVRAPVSLIDETQAWVAARLRMGWASTTPPTTIPYFFEFIDDSSNRLTCYYSAGALAMDRGSAGVFQTLTRATAWAAGATPTIIFAWTATQLKVSFDGSAFTTIASATIPTMAASTFGVCNAGAAATNQIDSDILWFACGTGTLTDGDAAVIHGYGNSDLFPSSFPGTCTAVFPMTSSLYFAITEPVWDTTQLPVLAAILS